MSAIRERFDQRLINLGHKVLRMGSLVDEAIELALRSLIERDSAIACRVIDNDKIINDLRYTVEEECYTLIATQQPLASDLRRVMATISIVTNMERMADHAAGIAVLARRLNKEPELKPLIDVPRMALIARSMLHRALDAYISADSKLAYEVAQEDHKINQLDEQVLRELLTYMLEEPRNIRRATYLLWISHNLERIGDRCKNICERVVYLANGQLANFDFHSDNDKQIDEHYMLENLI